MTSVYLFLVRLILAVPGATEPGVWELPATAVSCIGVIVGFREIRSLIRGKGGKLAGLLGLLLNLLLIGAIVWEWTLYLHRHGDGGSYILQYWRNLLH